MVSRGKKYCGMYRMKETSYATLVLLGFTMHQVGVPTVRKLTRREITDILVNAPLN